MQSPRTSDLPAPLADAARTVARTLGAAGYRAWVVGGAVRDLLLGRAVHDADLVSAARPEVVTGLFPRTVQVGAAFGIVVVVVGEGLEVEVATFREEREYSDGRRPDEVLYSDDAAVDAARRDFTCNALYLDPLDDTLLDPTGGLADLEARRLAAVGDAAQRFREDGLRLLRMARFEAALGLAPAPGLHEAARGALASLRGVSPERVLDELSKVFRGPRAGVACRALDDCGIADVAVPGYATQAHELRAARLAVLDGHGRCTGPDGGVATGLAALLEGADTESLRRHLEALRAPRLTIQATLEVERLAAAMPDLAQPTARPSARLRALRSPWFDAALDLALRRTAARNQSTAALQTLAAWRTTDAASDPAPTPWLTSADLRAAGLTPGPLFGKLLTEAEDLQLDGTLTSRTSALHWLQSRTSDEK